MKHNSLNQFLSKRSLLSALTLTLLAITLIGASVQAQDDKKALPNIVLVHGAWADASSWNAVIQTLQADGYTVNAPQIALESLDDDVARVREVLALQTGPTLLVAHSFGGAVITALGADAPNVVGLVYKSAFAPDEGETMKALTSGDPQPPSVVAFRPDAQGNLWLDPAGFVQYFASDVDPVQAQVMAAVQKPIAASEILSEEPFGAPAWKSFPTWYLISDGDQMIPTPAQQFFAQRMGATVETISGSHVLMVSHPNEVTAFIESAAQSILTEQ